MKILLTRLLVHLIGLSLLQATAWTPGAAMAATSEHVDIHAFVNDTCTIADEPYFVPVPEITDDANRMTPKFLPLIGLVIGKLAELFLSHEIQASANQVKSSAARKDTRYAMTAEMNLYLADMQAAPTLRINAHLGCMTIVAAKFMPETANCTANYAPKILGKENAGLPPEQWKTSRTDGSVENQLRRANICVEGSVHAIYEARFEFSDDGTAYRLRDAGYRINSLLTTDDKHATRTALYSLKVFRPAVTDQLEVLTSAWVKLGSVTAGSQSNGTAGTATPWLHVPAMSPEARRAYDEKTNVYQNVIGQIDALGRAIKLNQRLLGGLDHRIAESSGDIAVGLGQERTRIAVQIQLQSAELDARNEEYRDLPKAPLQFMPVTIEVAVTETESEKKAQLALADLLGSTGGAVASQVGGEVTKLASKSVSPSELKIEPDAAFDQDDIASARARYYDALIAISTSPSGTASEDSLRQVALTKSRYNDARRSTGQEPIK